MPWWRLWSLPFDSLPRRTQRYVLSNSLRHGLGDVGSPLAGYVRIAPAMSGRLPGLCLDGSGDVGSLPGTMSGQSRRCRVTSRGYVRTASAMSGRISRAMFGRLRQCVWSPLGAMFGRSRRCLVASRDYVRTAPAMSGHLSRAMSGRPRRCQIALDAVVLSDYLRQL